MAVEIRIVEITFDPNHYRGGNINQAENQLAQLIGQGWRIVASGGAGMGYGYNNADYRSYGDQEMGRYGCSLTGFVILQREKPREKPKAPQKQARQLSKDVQETMSGIKQLENRPRTKDRLENYLDSHNHPEEYIVKVINTLQNKGYISKDGTIDYNKI